MVLRQYTTVMYHLLAKYGHSFLKNRMWSLKKHYLKDLRWVCPFQALGEVSFEKMPKFHMHHEKMTWTLFICVRQAVTIKELITMETLMNWQQLQLNL